MLSLALQGHAQKLVDSLLLVVAPEGLLAVAVCLAIASVSASVDLLFQRQPGERSRCSVA